MHTSVMNYVGVHILSSGSPRVDLRHAIKHCVGLVAIRVAIEAVLIQDILVLALTPAGGGVCNFF